MVGCYLILLFLCVKHVQHKWTNVTTGVDLSKILSGQTKLLEGAKSDKCMGVSQLLGARAWAAPPSLRL